MQGNDLPAPFVRNGEESGVRLGQFGGSAYEAAGKIRQMQGTVNLMRQLDESFRATTMLVGKMKIPGSFQHDCSLIRERPGAANILFRDARAVQTVHDSEHSENAALRPQQRNC